MPLAMCNNNLTLLLLHSKTTLINFSLLNFGSSNKWQNASIESISGTCFKLIQCWIQA
ncbi:hypothetical protein RchiOBHm_Chr4g0427111 [Rosa chinensis]|uniref:Uncharacterized protein n=1 Tax=Rosa chinensis TaxID=74649 RepID=A0A2P6QZI9_ROSCH|nr:hypothetical protein RchiOBHm_Chr4g0427111 [Rosa chinensis]